MVEPEHRRLAAIMFTDIVGYVALTQRNEAHALVLLQEHDRLLRSIFARHGGQEIKTLGDGFLTEFASAVDAVRCAVEIQQALAERNTSVPAEGKLQVRIGIHVGEVVHRGDDILGDGVNVASRIRPLAEPGGICFSQSVLELVRSQIEAPVVRLGKRELKHVKVPVELYRIAPPGEERRFPLLNRLRLPSRQRGARRMFVTSTAALLLAWLAFSLWKRAQDEWIERPLRNMAPAMSRLPPLDKHRIAVLPFDNLSPDPRQDEYFVEGMQEELTTCLQSIRGLRVIDRQSVKQYQGSRKSVGEIGRDLNVGAVVEGSVRKAADQVRITAKLTDVRSQEPVWSHEYDGDLKGIFAIQSKTAQRIAQALQVQLAPAEKQQIEKQPTLSVEAHDLYLQGRDDYDRFTEEGMRAAADAFERALRIDPHYALARVGIAEASAEMNMTLAPPAEIRSWGERAQREAHRALALDPHLAQAHEAMAAVYWKTEFAWDRVIEESRQALGLNPNLDMPHYFLASAFTHLGLMERVDTELRQGLEINPEGGPSKAEALRVQCLHALYGGQFAEAARVASELRRLSPRRPALWVQGLGLFYAGQRTRGEALLEEACRSASAPIAARAQAALASVLAAQGERTRALAVINQVTHGPYIDHHVSAHVGAAYAQLGEHDKALRWLQHGVDTGLPCYPWYARDPMLDPLRGEAGFKRFLKDVRRMTEAAKKRYAV